MYGIVNYGGRDYVERMYTYVGIFTLTANQSLPSQRIVLDGEADFFLKLLTRASTGRFRIRLANTDGGIRYSSAGVVVGGGNDLVRDDLIFGNGSFPFPVSPYILFPATGAIMFDLQDISGGNNTIEFAFHGSKLFPANAQNQGN